MDMRKALEKAKSLLVENGIILVVGLGKPSSFLDYIIEGLRVIPNCQTEKDFEKLLPWNIKITEFHEEGTWKNNT